MRFLYFTLLLIIPQALMTPSVLATEPELPCPCFFNEHDRWLLHSYKDNKSQEEKTKPSTYQKFFEVIIQFDYDEHIQAGSFEGQSLSNLIYGKYKLLENNSIEVTSFEHSRMAEPRWGVDNLEIAMKSLNSFSCSGDTLFLHYNQGEHSLIFLKTDKVFYDWDLYFKGSKARKKITMDQ